MATVSDVRGLGRQLLIIAGLRTTHILNTKFGSLDEISFVPPNILSWLKHLVRECLFPLDQLLINFFQHALI